MAEKAGIGRDREVPKSLTDDPEFDNLMSIQLIYEREQVKTKIKSVLGLLIQAGLGELDIVKRQIENYQVEKK